MRCASVRAPPRSARRGAPRALSTRASPPSTPPPRPPPPGPPAGADRWTELRRLLAAGPSTHGEDFGRRVRKLVRPGEEASAVWAVARREAQASVLAAMAPTSGQLAQIVGAVLHAHPSANARTAGEALAPLVRHVGAGYSLDELRRALSPLPAQLERLAPEAMRAVPAGDSEWASGEVWGSLLGQAVPEPLRDDYEGVAAAVVQLLKAPWARAAPAPTGPPRALYSLRHAVRLGTSALAEFDQDWVNEEMFDAARTLQNELAQHFHQVHPGEAFGPAEYAALMTDLVTLLVQKLRRDTWTNVGFVNALVHHLSGEHVRGDDFIRFVHDVKSNLRGTLPQRLQAFAVDLAAPLTGRSYQWPPVRLRSIC